MLSYQKKQKEKKCETGMKMKYEIQSDLKTIRQSKIKIQNLFFIKDILKGTKSKFLIKLLYLT